MILRDCQFATCLPCKGSSMAPGQGRPRLISGVLWRVTPGQTITCRFIGEAGTGNVMMSYCLPIVPLFNILNTCPQFINLIFLFTGTASLGLWLRLECSFDSLSIDPAHVIYLAEGHNVGSERQSSVMTLRKPIVTWII